MIKVNNREYEWNKVKSLQSLMDELKYTYPVLVVTVNGEHVLKEGYESTMIKDGDDVKIIHPVCGG